MPLGIMDMDFVFYVVLRTIYRHFPKKVCKWVIQIIVIMGIKEFLKETANEK